MRSAPSPARGSGRGFGFGSGFGLGLGSGLRVRLGVGGGASGWGSGCSCVTERSLRQSGAASAFIASSTVCSAAPCAYASRARRAASRVPSAALPTCCSPPSSPGRGRGAAASRAATSASSACGEPLSSSGSWLGLDKGPPSLQCGAASTAAHWRLREVTRAEEGGLCRELDAILDFGLDLAALVAFASCSGGPSLWWWRPPKKLEASDGPLRPMAAAAPGCCLSLCSSWASSSEPRMCRSSEEEKPARYLSKHGHSKHSHTK